MSQKYSIRNKKLNTENRKLNLRPHLQLRSSHAHDRPRHGAVRRGVRAHAGRRARLQQPLRRPQGTGNYNTRECNDI